MKDYLNYWLHILAKLFLAQLWLAFFDCKRFLQRQIQNTAMLTEQGNQTGEYLANGYGVQ